MKKDLVTIIMPVYNGEKYLEEAIDSLLKQTLKDIQIIIVDDGSKDKTIEICKKYQKIDERIEVIEQANSGQAKARNAGLKQARGKYVMFLDADDTYNEDTCEVMFQIAERENADYVNANYIMMDDDGTKWPNPAFDVEKYTNFELHISDYKKSFFVMNSTPWNKIYNIEFLRNNGIDFAINPPSEDDYFTTLCYMKAKKGYYTNTVIYNYRNNLQSTSNVCSKEYFKKINEAYKRIYTNFKNNKKIGFYRYYYAKKNSYLLCRLIDTELLSDEEKIDCLKDLKWYFDLAEEIKVLAQHESLKLIMQNIKEENYEEAIIEMNKLKEIRKGYSVQIKNRMSFPTAENYEEISKYDNLFLNE